MARLEDVFAGNVVLTASQRSHVLFALNEVYMRGDRISVWSDRREFHRSVVEALGSMRLHLMVSPDGTELLSVVEHQRRFHPEMPSLLVESPDVDTSGAHEPVLDALETVWSAVRHLKSKTRERVLRGVLLIACGAADTAP